MMTDDRLIEHDAETCTEACVAKVIVLASALVAGLTALVLFFQWILG